MDVGTVEQALAERGLHLVDRNHGEVVAARLRTELLHVRRAGERLEVGMVDETGKAVERPRCHGCIPPDCMNGYELHIIDDS